VQAAFSNITVPKNASKKNPKRSFNETTQKLKNQKCIGFLQSKISIVKRTKKAIN